jgi:hypothetical protein
VSTSAHQSGWPFIIAMCLGCNLNQSVGLIRLEVYRAHQSTPAPHRGAVHGAPLVEARPIRCARSGGFHSYSGAPLDFCTGYRQVPGCTGAA